MSLAIYTYSNPYEINNEPFWDSVKNCAHFCVSQTMVNGLSAGAALPHRDLKALPVHIGQGEHLFIFRVHDDGGDEAPLVEFQFVQIHVTASHLFRLPGARP